VAQINVSKIINVVVKTLPALSTSTEDEAVPVAMDDITDVDASGESAGDTLVYNSTRDKYVVRQLTFEELADGSAIDGGTF